MAASGHPILGDTLYAPTAVQAASGRLLLHAAVLEFTHPAMETVQQFEAQVPF
jgi:tRNA pseudouridine32 synthase/23S rRNA pseudouridine746 synthase